MTKKYQFLALLLCITLNAVFCDLPVHCKREAIDGYWYFYIDDSVFQPMLNDLRTTCGHGLPDKIETTVGDKDFNFEKSSVMKIKLASDYKVYDEGVQIAAGTWTPVYDEGFIVNYKNSVFTAFMKYYKKNNQPEAEYISNCNKTMIGWFIPNTDKNNKDWKCFYGIKHNENSDTFENKLPNSITTKIEEIANVKSILRGTIQGEKPEHKHSLDSVFNILKTSSSFVEVSEKIEMENTSDSELFGKITVEELKKLKYEDQMEVVNEINSMELGWKADINGEFIGMSLLELNEHLGFNKVKKHKKHAIHKASMHSSHKFQKFNPFKMSNNPTSEKEPISKPRFKQLENSDINSTPSPTKFLSDKISDNSVREVDSEKIENFEQVQKYQNSKLEDINENELAINWDWRNVGGINFVPKLRKQGKCGSCYVFSTVSSLEARLRILTNNSDQTEFSRQFPLSCSFYTEGCEGGYPILAAKFFNEFEIVPESCMKYQEKNVPCEEVCDFTKNKKKYVVSSYGYIGGFYGATSEVLMMKEIRARGPIPGNISVPWAFSYYKNGIFSNSKIIKSNSGKLSKTTLFDKRISWEKVDHSITIVGWGEENGVKYWIGMNTWGSNWGENGFFRILRGENEGNIESMGDSFNIKVLDRY